MPFEQLPYQCFQEARKILQADREDKISQINAERRRISIVSARDAATMGGENTKKGRIMAMERHLEQLKIQADINDPVIKKRFEDGQGKPNVLSPFQVAQDLTSYRRHEPTDLPAPRRKEMALI